MPYVMRERLLAALVRGTYNGDSAFARGLASEGELIVPHVLSMVGASNEATRWNAYDLAALLLEGSDAGALARPLTRASRERLQSAARAGLQDPAAAVRRRSILAVVAAKDRGAIPVLVFLAETDPDTVPPDRSVRGLAAAGVEVLRRAK